MLNEIILETFERARTDSRPIKEIYTDVLAEFEALSVPEPPQPSDVKVSKVVKRNGKKCRVIVRHDNSEEVTAL